LVIFQIFVSFFRNDIPGRFASVEGPHFDHRCCKQVKEGFNEILLSAQTGVLLIITDSVSQPVLEMFM
jgi:hypothetical protein